MTPVQPSTSYSPLTDMYAAFGARMLNSPPTQSTYISFSPFVQTPAGVEDGMSELNIEENELASYEDEDEDEDEFATPGNIASANCYTDVEHLSRFKIDGRVETGRVEGVGYDRASVELIVICLGTIWESEEE